MQFTTILSEIKRQLIKLRFTLVVVWFISLLILGIGVLLQLRADISIRFLMRDVTAIASLPAYAGALSSLGIVLWSAAATICFFSAAVTGRFHSALSVQLFFYCSGVLTTLLLIDDLFQIHEDADDLLGMSEEALFVIYGVLMLLYFVTFGRRILQTDFLLFVLALGIFGFSLAVDVFPLVDLVEYDPEFFLGARENQYLVEDGSKFIGICFWLTYFAHTSAETLEARGELFHAQSPL